MKKSHKCSAIVQKASCLSASLAAWYLHWSIIYDECWSEILIGNHDSICPFKHLIFHQIKPREAEREKSGVGNQEMIYTDDIWDNCQAPAVSLGKMRPMKDLGKKRMRDSELASNSAEMVDV